jgi:transposase-like protein
MNCIVNKKAVEIKLHCSKKKGIIMTCPYCKSLKTVFVRIVNKEELWMCLACNSEFPEAMGNTGY